MNRKLRVYATHHAARAHFDVAAEHLGHGAVQKVAKNTMTLTGVSGDEIRYAHASRTEDVERFRGIRYTDIWIAPEVSDEVRATLKMMRTYPPETTEAPAKPPEQVEHCLPLNSVTGVLSLSVKPGDVVLVKTTGKLSDAVLGRIKKYFEDLMPGVRVGVLSEGIEVHAHVTMEQPKNAGFTIPENKININIDQKHDYTATEKSLRNRLAQAGNIKGDLFRS